MDLAALVVGASGSAIPTIGKPSTDRQTRRKEDKGRENNQQPISYYNCQPVRPSNYVCYGLCYMEYGMDLRHASEPLSEKDGTVL